MLSAILIILVGWNTAQAMNPAGYTVQVSSIIGKELSLYTQGKQLKEGDSAYLVHYRSNDQRRFFFPVAKLRIFNAEASISQAEITQSFEVPLQAGKKYLLFTLSDFLRGRGPHSFVQALLKVYPGAARAQVADSMGKEDYTLAKERDKYYAEPIDRQRVDLQAKKFKFYGVEQFIEHEGVMHSAPLVKVADAQSFFYDIDLSTFDKMVHATLRNNSRELPEQKDNLTLPYDQSVKHDQVVAKDVYDRRAHNFFAKGAAWSDNMTDEELSRTLTQYGELREIKRRETIPALHFKRQFYVNLGRNLGDSQTQKDERLGSFQVQFELSNEFFLFQKMKTINFLSLELSAKYAQNLVSLSDRNAKTSVFGVGAAINYYPFMDAALLGENILFTSLGAKLSSHSVELQDQSARYQGAAFPSFRLGVKYNMQSGFGLRLLWELEAYALDKSSGANELASSLSYTTNNILFSLSKLY